MATIEKKYVYKIARGTTYLGVLPNVVSDFSYSHNINSAGTQIEIQVADTADTSDLAVEGLEDEYGNPLQAEDGSQLTTERVADLVGDGNANALIRNDNKVEVVEFSETYPNGSTVFRGFISKYKVTFGGTDSVSITVLSNGQDLNHYLVPGETADQVDVSQTSANSGTYLWESGTPFRAGQTFKVGSGVTNISSIIVSLKCSISRDATLKLFNSVADYSSGATPLGTVTKTITTASYTDYTFTFSSPVSVTALSTYFLVLYGPTFTTLGEAVLFQYQSTDVYANGSLYFHNPGGAYDPIQAQTGDIYFKTYRSANSTSQTFTSTDVSTILTTIMAYYSTSGGTIALSTPSATSYTPTYRFNINTTLEGIQKVLELGPATWYWYTNPATDVMEYKVTGTTADHTIIKGRHINELSIEATKEQLANVIYFTGGDAGSGANVYANVNDTASLVNNRRGLVRLNDPKVKGATGVATGTIIAQNYIAGHNAQTYITQVEIIDGTYDITLLKLGQIVGFGSFGTFVDQLLLQIVSIQRKVDSVVLSLGALPHRATEQMEEVQRSLEASQTVDNPTSPS